MYTYGQRIKWTENSKYTQKDHKTEKKICNPSEMNHLHISCTKQVVSKLK